MDDKKETVEKKPRARRKSKADEPMQAEGLENAASNDDAEKGGLVESVSISETKDGESVRVEEELVNGDGGGNKASGFFSRILKGGGEVMKKNADMADNSCAPPAGKKGGSTIMGNITKHFPERMRRFFSVNWMAPVAGVLFVMMFATMGAYVFRQKEAAEEILRYGPEKAYALEQAKHYDEAHRLWVQINAKAPWYMYFSGFGTNIDEPFLQRAAIAFQAKNWEDVAANAYKALNVPITDSQAVYVQQMILTSTARMVRAYLPDQINQPVKGGVPDHAPPICDPSGNVWIVPMVLVIVAALCLYGRMRIVFALVAISMPAYFWLVSLHNESAIRACEARLVFNPAHIELYGQAPDPTGQPFREVVSHVEQPDSGTFLTVPMPDENR